MPEIFYKVGFPRSGNSLGSHTLDHYYGIRSRPPGMLNLPENKLRQLIRQRGWPNWLDSDMFAWGTHDKARKGQDWPALVITRDGRDAAVSLAHYMRKMERIDLPFEPLLRRIAKGRVKPALSFGDWTDFHEYWLHEYPGPISVLRFEDVITAEDPLVPVSRAMSKLYPNLEPIRTDPPPSFAELHAKNPDYYRRGQAGAWRDEMSEEIEQIFWENNAPMMLELGYER